MNRFLRLLLLVFLSGGILALSPLAFANERNEILKSKAGQLMWVGYHSQDQIKDIKPSGLAFFGWNIHSGTDLKMAVKQLRTTEITAGIPRILTALDHEGGKIIRLKRGLSFVPDAAALGATRDTDLVEKVSFIMARELRNIGVDINFAPVLDRGDARSFLENRIWSDNSDVVTQMTGAFLEGHLKGGTFPFPKHFPGHGPTAFQDAHFLMPVNSESKSNLMKNEMPPFLQFMKDSRTQALMTAHVELSALDRQPASLSKRVLTDFLRKELGYSGFILSDDLEMGALTSEQSHDVAELAIQSLKSGVDAVLVVWSLVEQRRVRDRIVKALKSGELSEVEVDQKIARMEVLRKRILDIKAASQKIPSLSFEDKKATLEQAWMNSETWVLGSEQRNSELFAAAADKTWTVVVPPGPYRDLWKSLRPQDQVTLFDFKAGQYDGIFQALTQKVRAKAPIILVTSPLHADAGEWVRHLSRFLNRSYKDPKSVAPVLWVHMGMLPVKVPRIEKPEKPMSLVLLNSATSLGLRHFLGVLTSRNSAWNSVSQKYSLSSP